MIILPGSIDELMIKLNSQKEKTIEQQILYVAADLVLNVYEEDRRLIVKLDKIIL